MRARTLGQNCAVEPLRQKEARTHGGIIIPPTAREYGSDALLGRVLCVGSRVSAVKVGDTVMYEKQSGHKGQTGKIEADLFGGTPGRYAVIIACHEPLPTVAARDDAEADKRTARMEEIQAVAKRRPLTKDEDDELRTQSYHMARINLARARGERTRRIKMSTKEHGRRRGIIAVVADANG